MAPADENRCASMTTRFVELSVDWVPSQQELITQIEATLRLHGEPLRWSVTGVEPDGHRIRVEAVVTQGDWTL